MSLKINLKTCAPTGSKEQELSMALSYCTACGQQVSDEARNCPHCGHPRKKSRSPILWMVLGVLVFLVIVGILASVGASKSAKFDVTNVTHDDSCTIFGDFCVRAYCTIVNNGDGDGSREVGANLLVGETVVATRRMTLTLAPGESKSLYWDFMEAELDYDSQYHTQCHY
jgi:DNA-directed RNA polymerase subunit RPC12/RpoP